MDNNEKKGHVPARPDAADGAPDPKIGPVGLTRNEGQRRRLIITGIATPALMTLPSRRVWASKCTKSKLLSGNLSATKKKGLECGDLGCKDGDWSNPDLYVIGGENWTSTSFNSAVDPGGVVFSGAYSLLQALNKDDKPGEWNGTENDYEHEGTLNDVAKEAAAAYLNSVYIKWPPPNDVFNFSLSEAAVRNLWGQAVTASLNDEKPTLDSIKAQLENANDTGPLGDKTSCPFK